MYKCIYLLVVACVLYALPSQAALKAKDSATPQEAWNPVPAQGDILLPMPCNMQMAFRVVAVPTKGLLRDMPMRLGRDDTANQDRGYYDSRYTTALSAPFTRQDLPQPWQGSLPTGDNMYYLIGKYEVSALQWEAVMGATCPKTDAISAQDAQPKTDISWYDANTFSERYTSWLLQQHPEALPHFAGDSRNIGFIRLPTEVEWEYAARGGHLATSQWLMEEDFFALPEGATLIDYAVFRPEDGARREEQPLRIGSRKANPLGVHDTAGNVAEMVMDSFHFSLGGRLHGSAGGFIRKGGSYLSGTAEIMPGRREEVAYFQKNGVVRTRDMGLRLVVSGINTPAGNRPDALRSAWQKAGEEYSLLLDDARNPLEAIDRLISLASNEAEKKNLQQIRNVIKENNIALERHQQQSAQSLVRTAVFMIETVRGFSIRRTLTDYMQQREGDTNKELAKKNRQVHDNLDKAMQQSAALYHSKLQEVRTYPANIFDEALDIFKKELVGEDKFTQRLKSDLGIYEQHVQAIRKGRKLNTQSIITDMLSKK